ncbi:MAG: hypothetical protein H0X04_00140 [Chthoniobacterales bacterium]|nr:hypothetical protein [Chthoniobacterales bacterium]
MFNDAFANSIKDDIAIFDGLRRVKFIHRGTGQPNLTTGILANFERSYFSDRCLFRTGMQRLSQSVKQITVRLESVQQDDFNSYAMVAELTPDVIDEFGDPVKLSVAAGDMLVEVNVQNEEIGPRYVCTPFDNTTLETRIRVGCRRLV